MRITGYKVWYPSIGYPDHVFIAQPVNGTLHKV